MSRWIQLYATSPSGKTLFVCRMCGCQSPVPTSVCSAPPSVTGKTPLPCALLEEMQEALEEVETGEVASGLKYFYVNLGVEYYKDGKFSVQWRDKDNVWHVASGLMTRETVEQVRKATKEHDDE